MKLDPELLTKPEALAMLSLLTCVASGAKICAVETVAGGQVTAGTGPVRYASIEETACPREFCTGKLAFRTMRWDQSLEKCWLPNPLPKLLGAEVAFHVIHGGIHIIALLCREHLFPCTDEGVLPRSAFMHRQRDA